MDLNQLYKEDCNKILKTLPDKCIDLILEDMPYNNTALQFEYKVDLEAYWHERLRVIKDNGAIVLTGQQPFSSDLIQSQRKLFRYEIIWEKTIKMGFLNANKMPLRGHENILIFYKKLPTYNPQKYHVKPDRKADVKRADYNYKGYACNTKFPYKDTGERHPHTVLKISNHYGGCDKDFKAKEHFHPTQKPVELFSWLIKTYTNPGGLVFDGFAGAATTAISCIREGRNYMCCEWDDEYHYKSQQRIELELTTPTQTKIQFA